MFKNILRTLHIEAEILKILKNVQPASLSPKIRRSYKKI